MATETPRNVRACQLRATAMPIAAHPAARVRPIGRACPSLAVASHTWTCQLVPNRAPLIASLTALGLIPGAGSTCQGARGQVIGMNTVPNPSPKHQTSSAHANDSARRV
jgi:hypothetical protein